MYLTPEIRAVVAALSSGPDFERVVCAVVFEQRPVYEVAREVGVPVRTCERWVARARARLRELATRRDFDLVSMAKHPDERESLPEDPDDAL